MLLAALRPLPPRCNPSTDSAHASHLTPSEPPPHPLCTPSAPPAPPVQAIEVSWQQEAAVTSYCVLVCLWLINWVAAIAWASMSCAVAYWFV